MANVETNIRALTAYMMAGVRDAIQKFEAGKPEKASTYKVPTRATGGNGDIRDTAVNGMVAVDSNGLVDHDGKCLKLKFFLAEIFC